MQGVFWKAAFLEILRSLLLTGVAGSQYTFCNATKNELQTSALKLTENFEEAKPQIKVFLAQMK